MSLDGVAAERRNSSADIIAGAQELRQKTQERIESNRGGKKKWFKFGKKKDTSVDDQKDLKAELSMDEHKVDFDVLYGRYNIASAQEGLKQESIAARQNEDGLNMLTPPKQRPEWLKFVDAQTGIFSLLLWVAGIACFVSYGLQQSQDNLVLGIVLCIVVFVTGVFSYFQERKSSNLMESFKNMLPTMTTVIRDGNATKLSAKDLCRGDIIKLKGGDKVPADVRVVECSDDMKVDNSSLTGESLAIKREDKCTHENPLETRNMCYFGTLIPSGTATCMVVNIGDFTVMGRIAALSLQTENVDTPIAREIHHFIKIIGSIAIILGVGFFAYKLKLNLDFMDPVAGFTEALVLMIGIIVANVPEGLLATVTVCLTLTAQRMHKKMVLVKNLEGVETLGSTSCICSDKTGTLTQNIMTVVNCVYDLQIWDAQQNNKPQNFKDDDPSFKRLQQCATLCNTAVFDKESQFVLDPNTGERVQPEQAMPFSDDVVLGDGTMEHRVMWKPIGDASESAMIKFCQPKRDILAFRAECPVQEKGKIPFNSANKYQAQIVWDAGEGCWVNEFKGAPERVTARCDTILLNGEVVPMTDEHRKKIGQLQTQLSREGKRCLGFAEKKLDIKAYPKDYAWDSDAINFPVGEPEESFAAKQDMSKQTGAAAPPPQMKEGLTYLGIMALIDPPRPQVPGAVELCKTAGIKVIMVTGDHPETAKAIAKEVGIIWGETCDDLKMFNDDNNLKEGDAGYRDPDLAPAIVVPGWDLSIDTPEEVWDDILAHSQVVFARTSPQQKLIIVENCQKRKHVVAVTGDGVNDSPALKKADIGVAMGIMGTDVSKEAADMILLDDNFASIVSGVEEGRLIFDNLKKSIAYTLSSNIPEISPFLAFVTVEVPLPLTTILILLIDLGTDMIPAISMAWETAEADIMKRNPRDAEVDRLVTAKLVSFAYLQIGVIQAISGFFTWIVVLNDYGYPPHTLMGLGAVDAWGKQTLFCETNGGVWRNFKGEGCPCFDYAYTTTTEEIEAKAGSQFDALDYMCSPVAGKDWWSTTPGTDTNTPAAKRNRLDVIAQCQIFGFMHWDQDSSMQYVDTLTMESREDVKPEVVQCGFAARNFAEFNNNVDDSGRNFDFQSASTYVGLTPDSLTVEHPTGTYTSDTETSEGLAFVGSVSNGQPTKHSIDAMRFGLGMMQYIPYRGVTSHFMNRKFLDWNTNTDSDGHSRVNGLGQDVNTQLLFQYQPVGAWNPYEGSRWSADHTEKGKPEINMGQRGAGPFVSNHVVCTCENDNPGKTWPEETGSGSDENCAKAPFCISKFKFYNGYLNQNLELPWHGPNYSPSNNTVQAYQSQVLTSVGSSGDLNTFNNALLNDWTPNDNKNTRFTACMLQQSRCANDQFFDHAPAGSKSVCSQFLENPTMEYSALGIKDVCYSNGGDDNTEDATTLLNVGSRTLGDFALNNAQTASFIAIIIVQWADLVICKTRWLSIRQQGMRNDVMNFALVWELLLGAMICYIPGTSAILIQPLRMTHWFTAVPFSIFIFLYDETRKYLMRMTSITMTDKTTGRTLRDPGWLERNTYY